MSRLSDHPDGNVSVYLSTDNSYHGSTTQSGFTRGYSDHGSTILPVEYYKDSFYLWILTSVTIVGFLGNTVSIVTIVRLHPITSSSLCIIFLALADTLSLLSKTAYMQLSFHNVNIGHSGCKIFPYLMNTLPMIANWIIVVMTTERFVATWYPLWIYKISTLRTTSMVTFGIVMFFFAINSVHLILFEQVSDSQARYYCLPHQDFRHFIVKIWFWTEGSFAVILPCIALIALNSLIVIGARKSFQPGSVQKRKQQAQLTAMLVTVSAMFILLTIPGVIFSIVIGKWHYYASPDLKNASTTVRILSDLNHSINFFLYFLTGRRFRRHLFLANLESQRPRRAQSV